MLGNALDRSRCAEALARPRTARPGEALPGRDRARPHRDLRATSCSTPTRRSASTSIDALGLAGDPAAIAALEPLTKDHDPQVAQPRSAPSRGYVQATTAGAEVAAQAVPRRARRAATVASARVSTIARPSTSPRDLLGKVLVHNRRGVRTSGVIVEVEAYIGESDPACHAAPGPTAATRRSTALPGYAYVYLNYGIHCLVNVVTEAHGSPAAVLIRALDPLDGIAVMRRRRGAGDEGPARGSASAIATPRSLPRPGQSDDGDGDHAGGEPARSASAIGCSSRTAASRSTAIAWGPRIGIRVGTETPWRAWIAGHPAVSRTQNAVSPSCASCLEPRVVRTFRSAMSAGLRGLHDVADSVQRPLSSPASR